MTIEIQSLPFAMLVSRKRLQTSVIGRWKAKAKGLLFPKINYFMSILKTAKGWAIETNLSEHRPATISDLADSYTETIEGYIRLLMVASANEDFENALTYPMFQLLENMLPDIPNAKAMFKDLSEMSEKE